MSGKYQCCIDKERLNGSVKTLNELEDYLNNKYLLNNILEIEDIIRNTNINHNNCIENYKEKINTILDELQKLKKSINKLNDSVTITLKEFSEADQFKTKDVEDIFGKFNNSTDVASLSVNNNLNVANNVKLFKENMATNVISVADVETNTVPVGLGIAAAGITGAVGAVVVDSMMDKSKKETSESFNELETYEEEPKEIKEEKKIEETPTPYFASRDKVKNDKFYDDIK